jgi:outer membrane protein
MNAHPLLLATAAGLMLTCAATRAFAEDALAAVPESAVSEESRERALPRWEAGVVGFGATQPAYPGADTNTSRALVLPYLVYRGEYLRSDRGGVGVRAVKTARLELDVGFAGSLGSNASDVDARRGMADIGILVEMGPQLKINLTDVADGPGSSRIELPLRGVFDLNDDLRFKGLAFNPTWVTTHGLPGRWAATWSVGAVWGSRKLTGTFYDVKANEVTATRPAYDASSGLIALRAGLSLSRPIGNTARFFTFVRQESLAGAANNDSPLVQRRSGTSAGLGISWSFLQSGQTAPN